MKSLPTRLLVFCLFPESVIAAGYYLPNQDALATAKGNAWVATADSAAAVHYNPAGLTQLKNPEASVGLYVIQLGNEAEIGGRKYKPKSEWQGVPNVYYAQPLNDRVALGFGLNVPFGLGNDWGQETPFRTIVTETRLSHPSAILALGYKLDEQLSLGGSVAINYIDLTLEQGLGFFPGDYLRFEGDGFSVSGSLSLRWQPHEKHAFGLVVSSGTNPTLDGKVHSNVLDNGSAEFEFMTPLRVAAGYSYRPAPGWNLEGNIEWLDWDSLNTLDLKGSMLPPSGVASVPFNWQSSFIYAIGATYHADSGYIFAVGYDYNESAQPDGTYQPGVADADRHWLNAGVGLRRGNAKWFLTYQFGYSNRTVSGNPNNVAGETTNGRYEARDHAFALSYQYNFR